MNRHSMERQMLHEMTSERGMALTMSGLWLRVAFVGTSAFAGGLVALFSGEATPALALAIVAIGASVAAIAYRRAWVVLDRIDSDPKPRQSVPTITATHRFARTE